MGTYEKSFMHRNGREIDVLIHESATRSNVHHDLMAACMALTDDHLDGARTIKFGIVSPFEYFPVVQIMCSDGEIREAAYGYDVGWVTPTEVGDPEVLAMIVNLFAEAE